MRSSRQRSAETSKFVVNNNSESWDMLHGPNDQPGRTKTKRFNGAAMPGRLWASCICFIIICFTWCCYIIHCENMSHIVWIMNIWCYSIQHRTWDCMSTKYWLFKICKHFWQFFAFSILQSWSLIKDIVKWFHILLAPPPVISDYY